MKKLIMVFLYIFIASLPVSARELYRVTICGEFDAISLNAIDMDVVMPVSGGYLVLVDFKAEEELDHLAIGHDLIASQIDFDQIAVENHRDALQGKQVQPIFEENGLRLYRLPANKLTSGELRGLFTPIQQINIPVKFVPAKSFNPYPAMGDLNLDSLIDLVSMDTIVSLMERLEAFDGRLTGTDSCYAARNWIAGKFASYGFDSIVIDSFVGSQLWSYDPVESQNIVAVKLGTAYPDKQIIVGGHFDVVPDCPGQDDNGSGTAGTMEIARILAGMETNMTFVFIAFDSEESWLWGSYHYAENAVARGDDIVYMMNLDMIANQLNDSAANLYNGPVQAYSELWAALADSLVGIEGILAGTEASDHLPFQQAGYDVTFVQEYIFSPEYHCYDNTRDDNAHLSFEYMTRMVKASLATVVTIDRALPPIPITSIRDVGDGHSLQINWTPPESDRIDHYTLFFAPAFKSVSDSIVIPADSSNYIVSGLMEEVTYTFFLAPYDTAGASAIVINSASAAPYFLPMPPDSIVASPLLNAIKIEWAANNTELDFSHYLVTRDGEVIGDTIFTTQFIDDDPGLGSDFHTYYVHSVDTDDNLSDSAYGGGDAVSMKAATLDQSRIMALNRSHVSSIQLVDETRTGAIMREALNGYNFDYYSDTAIDLTEKGISLLDFIDYGTVIIGDEAGRSDNIGMDPALGGLLEDLDSYLSIGGRAIIFRRWGDLVMSERIDTLFMNDTPYCSEYASCFHMIGQVMPLSIIHSVAGSPSISSDFIGAHSQTAEYPDLVWDSAATLMHTGAPFADISGIPCASFPMLMTDSVEVIYTYDSSTDSLLTEGQPIAWKYMGDSYKYVFFNIPLSFMEHDDAVLALQQAVADMGIVTSIDDQTSAPVIPKTFALEQNFPNPFNPVTTIRFYNPESVPAQVTVEVYNIIGQQVKLLFDGPAAPGMNAVEWDSRDDNNEPVATGIYFYRLTAGSVTLTRKMVLLK